MRALAASMVVGILGWAWPTSGTEAMRPAMGTYARVEVTDPAGAESAIEAALDEIARLDRVMSTYKEDSEVSGLNRTPAGTWVPVSADLYEVLALSLRYYRVTDGAFDMTVGPLVRLWKRCERIPSTTEIRRTLERVGSRRVNLDGDDHVVSLTTPGVEIDLGGIGKGFAVDRAVAVLRSYGVRAGVVDLGRMLYCEGQADTGDWEVGVVHPTHPGVLAAVIRVRDVAISTSGNYEQSRVVEGRAIGHVVDPRTGYPVDNGVVSVTVVAPTGTAADALSTAIFVLGVDAGTALLSQLDGIEGLVIFENKDGDYGYTASESLRVEWLVPDISERRPREAR